MEAKMKRMKFLFGQRRMQVLLTKEKLHALHFCLHLCLTRAPEPVYGISCVPPALARVPHLFRPPRQIWREAWNPSGPIPLGPSAHTVPLGRFVALGQMSSGDWNCVACFDNDPQSSASRRAGYRQGSPEH